MTYQEIIAYLVSATADLRLSGGLLELDNASVRLPDELRVEVSKSGERVDVEFSPPLVAEKSVGLCNVAVRVPSLFITPDYVVARTRLGNVRICAVPHEPIVFGAARSPEWDELRDEWVRENPTCAACGGTEELQVHHIVPVSVDSSRELDRSNLITLCMAPTRQCHFEKGHCYHWSAYNPHVVEDAALSLKRIRERVEAA